MTDSSFKHPIPDHENFIEEVKRQKFEVKGEKVKLGTPFGLVDAGTYAMLGYLANAKTFGVKIYSESNEYIKEVETNGLTFEYKRDLQIEEGIYNLYIYAKGYDVFLDSDLYGPCKINYKEVK